MWDRKALLFNIQHMNPLLVPKTITNLTYNTTQYLHRWAYTLETQTRHTPVGLTTECKKFEITQSNSKNRLQENNWYPLWWNSFFNYDVGLVKKMFALPQDYAMRILERLDIVPKWKKNTRLVWKKPWRGRRFTISIALLDNLYCGF